MDFKDYYAILGVGKGADAKKIKKEYRKLARKYHPDVNHNDAEAERKFKDLGEAYTVLKDPEKRKAYDQYGANWKNGPQQQQQHQQHRQRHYQPSGGDGGGGFGGGFDFGGDFSGAGEYSDFFESMFGGGHRGGRANRAPFQQRGSDIDASITIPLEDAYHGSSRTITFTTPVVSASGQVENKKRTLNVKIPKGIKKGGKIRLKGQGAPGHNGAPAGDMFLKVNIDKHAVFDVEGSDVYIKLPIAPWEAALGAKVDVPTPAGTIELKIPKGTQSGKKMRLKSQGVPSKKAGHLYVEIQIVLPPADNDEARNMYRDMQKLNFNPRDGFGV
jgi:curved DNA-binding protein